jgi:hypothetical protein
MMIRSERRGKLTTIEEDSRDPPGRLERALAGAA